MTHHQTLQNDQNTNQYVVKAAYRALSLKYHPDRNIGAEKQCLSRMQQINNAYSILSDATRRAIYDQTLVITPKRAYTPPKPDPTKPQPAHQPKPKPEPEPDYEPAPKPDYNKPGREWDYGFEANQPKSKAKHEPKTQQKHASVPFKYHILNFLEWFWDGIKGFFSVVWKVYCVMIWPILKWTVFGVFFILIALLGCGGGGGGGSGRCRYDDRYRW